MKNSRNSRAALFGLLALSLKLLILCICPLGLQKFGIALAFPFALGGILASSDSGENSRLSGRCRRCTGLIVYSDDNGKTWRHYKGQLHTSHEVDFIPDSSVAPDLPKEVLEHSDGKSTGKEKEMALAPKSGPVISGLPRVIAKKRMDLFQMSFENDGSNITVLDGDNTATRVSPFEISPSRVFYQTSVSCVTELVPRRRRSRRSSEDEEESEPELIERELPFLVYVTPISRGWIHIPKTARIQIGKSKLLVTPSIQYPLGLTSKLLDAFRKGEFAIDPVDMFSIVNEFLQDHIDFSATDGGLCRLSEICSTWGIGTHFHQAFRTFPFIKYEGPPGCGKTTANWTTASICFHPIPTPDLSDPCLYRLREAANGTIAMDERDFKKKSTESRLDDFLNNGFTKGGFVFRNVKDELGNIVPTPFSVYGPFSFSGVQDLPYMTETRTLMIPMRKTLLKRYSGTIVSPFDAEATRIRDMLYLCRFLFGMKIAEIYEQLNVEDFHLDTRAWDLAHPLIAVASLFAPDKIPNIIEYVNSQVTEREGEATDRGEIKVLLALSEIVKLKQTETQTKLGASNPASNLPIEFPLGLTAIKNQILEMFADENKDWWPNRRIAKSLRQLGFLKKSRSGARGEFQYFINIHGVNDWLTRLRLTGPTEGTEHD